MDETTRGIITGMRRIVAGREQYSSAHLNPNELTRLAADAIGHLDEDFFDVALGLAYQGILFASALAGGRPVAILQHDDTVWGPPLQGKRVLIVDDIVLDLARFQRGAAIVGNLGGTVVGFASIIDLTKGAAATLTAPFWSADQTP